MPGYTAKATPTEGGSDLLASASLPLSSMQLRDARLLLGWSLDRLALVMGISTRTRARLEHGGTGDYADALVWARAAFEVAGIEFMQDGPPGLLFRPGAAER